MELNNYHAKQDKSIREHTDDLLKRACVLKQYGYINQRLYDLLIVACEYHDYGKVNPMFQKRIKSKSNKFNATLEVAHNVLSLFFIDKQIFKNAQDYYTIAHAVLNHHDYGDPLEIIDEKSELISRLLEGFDTYQLKKRMRNKINDARDNDLAILIKGLLHKCDYSASAGLPIEYKNDFLEEGLEQLMKRWEKANDEAQWNELQYFCIKNSRENIVVTAQTGLGKTEAGLHWIGNHKGFFILPIKTAINAIYERVKNDILLEDCIDEKLALLHSDMLSHYNNNSTIGSDIDILDYYHKSKQLSMPINIATLDQLFNFVFKYPGYELKLATLSYSKVVIDEIQMYGPDLLAYLIYGIKTLNAFGGKFAILTATLPPFILDLLNDDDECALSFNFKHATFTTNLSRHHLKVSESELDIDTIYKHYTDNEEKQVSNKILVVCNTVKKAQELFQGLQKNEVNNLNILHSKFIKKDRGVKEKAIINFGETYKKASDGSYILDDGGAKILNNDSGIWIATQIVEASLDIDFDYLFTELSDLNSLLQRLGRCNRKGAKTVEEPNCFVFTEINKHLFKNGKKGFIDKKIYEISKEAVLGVNGILSEQDKVNLINNNLTTNKLSDSDYLKEYGGHYSYIKGLYSYEYNKKETLERFRNIISYNVIPNCVYESNKDALDKHISKLHERETKKDSIIQRINSREFIMNHTVPVGYYDIYFKQGDAIKKRRKLTKNEEILIIDCKYSDLGFERLSTDELKKRIVVDNFDNFI